MVDGFLSDAAAPVWPKEWLHRRLGRDSVSVRFVCGLQTRLNLINKRKSLTPSCPGRKLMSFAVSTWARFAGFRSQSPERANVSRVPGKARLP